MSRLSVSVTRVSADEESDFAPLWIASRVATGQSEAWAERAISEGRVSLAVAREDIRIYVARVDAAYVGFVVVTHSPLSGLGDESAAWVDQIYVDPDYRRTGVAQALLLKAADYAEHVGANQLISCVPAQEKDSNRYFARLGFTPLAIGRTTTPTALRRRLAGGEKESNSEAVVRRRRSLRARSRARRIDVARGTGV